MKKIIKAGIAFVLLLCIAGGIFVAVKLSKKWPEGMVYSSDGFQQRAFTEDGMYYFDYNTLKFYDKTTGKDVAVCSKPNCEHKGESCYAHFDAEPYFGSVMVYDDKIYVDALNDETIELEDGSTFETGIVKLYQMDMDGSNRKEICSIDGAILSMLAVDGKLYYTAYIRTVHEENTYVEDCALYCYDINWGTNKELCLFKGSDTRYSASLACFPHPIPHPACICSMNIMTGKLMNLILIRKNFIQHM